MPLTVLYTFFANPARQKPAFALTLIALLCSSALSAKAQGDWGYDEPGRKIEQIRPSAKSSAPAEALQSEKNSRALKKTQTQPAAALPALNDERSWLEIFALCASSSSDDDRKEVFKLATLSTDQRNHLTRMVQTRLSQPKNQFVGITPVWSALRPKIVEEMDDKESYRLLFRALLRHHLSKEQEHNQEFELLQDLLGATRIADPGPPVLTEDAVNAYSDMTCFLYQKRKPDRSVDGDDNRQTFALVVKDRFTRAPNLQAKTAMTNFDLTWACFRCRFLDVAPAEQEKLSALMSSGDSKSSALLKAELVSPTMLKLFALGPWSEKVIAPQAPEPLKSESARAEKLKNN